MPIHQLSADSVPYPSDSSLVEYAEFGREQPSLTSYLSGRVKDICKSITKSDVLKTIAIVALIALTITAIVLAWPVAVGATLATVTIIAVGCFVKKICYPERTETQAPSAQEIWANTQ